jgi:prepilin-type N-terminal cleavage/methylation domain-containing protein
VTARRGVTLVELLVALTVASVVLAGALRVALGATRSSDRTRERARQQALFRASTSVLGHELAGLDPVTDLETLSPDSLTLRTIRGTGRTCGTEAGAVVVALATLRAWRLPDVDRDSLRIPAASGASWITVPLLGAASRSRCADGSPGLRLPVDDGLAQRAALVSVSVRVVEWVRFRLYSNADGWWLGARSLRAGDVTQPIAGPFTVRALTFRFLDGRGTPTADRASLRSIALAMRTVNGPGERGVAADSVVAWLPLRPREGT